MNWKTTTHDDINEISMFSNVLLILQLMPRDTFYELQDRLFQIWCDADEEKSFYVYADE